jgi:hypothetical protein
VKFLLRKSWDSHPLKCNYRQVLLESDEMLGEGKDFSESFLNDGWFYSERM